MGASYAKATMPRSPKRREPPPEAEWTLGWVFPIKTDSAPGETDSPLGLKLLQDETNLEERS